MLLFQTPLTPSVTEFFLSLSSSGVSVVQKKFESHWAIHKNMWLKLVPSVICGHWPINLQEFLTLTDGNKWMTSILIFSGCEVTNKNEMCKLQTIQAHCSWAWVHLALTVVQNLSGTGLNRSVLETDGAVQNRTKKREQSPPELTLTHSYLLLQIHSLRTVFSQEMRIKWIWHK